MSKEKMTIKRVLEIAEGATPTPEEARELADEVLLLREAMHRCRVDADTISEIVTRAVPQNTLGNWRGR